jgi:hypothetical protein
MVIIKEQVGKNTIENVLLDGRLSVNIIRKQLTIKLGLPKPKPTPYNLKMEGQVTTKPMTLV